MNNKKIIPILIVLTIIFTILGATFAYWSWTSDNANKTNITFTIGADFSCGASGGGNIASSNIAPASCTNSTYAIRREITTTITNSGSDPVSMDMWLTVNSIGSGLANSSNFKWALTTDSTTCGSNVINQGTFQGKTVNSTVTILSGSTTTTSTYYLYIWLDAAETSTTSQNQSYSFSLGGSCTNSPEQTVYTSNLYDENATGWNSVWIGQTMPVGITAYNSPDAAITALETAYSNANSGATASLPFFLKHTLADGSFWCAVNSSEGLSACIFESQSDCNSKVSDYFGEGYVCQENSVSGGVTESYVGFVVTPAMATANPGMTAGTYYLKGGDDGRSFLDNAKTIYDAFGGVGCYLDGNSGGNPYTTTPSSYFSCVVSGVDACADSYGSVYADDNAGSRCGVAVDGFSNCNVDEDGG